MTAIATTAMGLALAYGFGANLGKTILNGSDHFKTCLGRASMQASVTALVYFSGAYLMPEFEGNPLVTAGMAVGGFYGACRVGHSILSKADRFETLSGRITETAVSVGVAVAMLHIGAKFDITAFDTASAAISTTGWAISTGVSLGAQALSGVASLLF